MKFLKLVNSSWLGYTGNQMSRCCYSDLTSSSTKTIENSKSSSEPLLEPSRLPTYAEVFPHEVQRLSQPVHSQQENYGGVGFRARTFSESLFGPGGLSNALGINWLRSGWSLYRDHRLDWILPIVMRITRKAADDRHTYHAFKYFKIKELQQMPSPALQRSLGWQILASHCVIRLGGAVQLQGSGRWLNNVNRLPSLRRPDILVESIDGTGSHLMRDGFRNYLENLHALKFLRLKNAPFVDDHCLASIARMSSLLYLDISHCNQITANGLASLWKLKDLRLLELRGLDRIPHIHQVAFQLMELQPQLVVKGLVAFESDEGLKKMLAAEDIQFPLTESTDMTQPQDLISETEYSDESGEDGQSDRAKPDRLVADSLR